MIRAWFLLLLAACGDVRSTPRPPQAVAPGQLRIVSYNVNFGIAGDAAGVAAVADAHGDLVFLQETNAAWEEAFVTMLGARYPHRKFTAPREWPAGGMGVMSTVPIVSIDELPTHGGMFFAWRVVLDTELGRIQVLNVHLRPPMSDGGSWVVGYFSTRDDRLREIEYHAAALDRSLPTLVVGDFNEEGDGHAITYLREHGFSDALAEHVGGRITWEWPVGAITLRFQLDHLMHDDHLIAVTAGVIDAGHSDHKPIWGDFELPTPVR